MMDHVLDWLQAYHDGELQERQVRRVEAHLAHCESCRAELEALQAISSLLQESPVASDLVRPDQFVAQVELQLPRRPVQTPLQRTLEAGWRLIPVGLLGALAFVQTVFVVASALLMTQNFPATAGLFSSILPPVSSSSWLTGLQCFAGKGLGDWLEIVRCAARYIAPLEWPIMLSAILFAGIGLLYLSWLASWWVRHNRIETASIA
ncbi:MAG: zf-HC2 domain-containing protein [Anaerolineae bacterium]|nr:zf-HC2 domain-containing protein [Anaerolineae bacterium]